MHIWRQMLGTVWYIVVHFSKGSHAADDGCVLFSWDKKSSHAVGTRKVASGLGFGWRAKDAGALLERFVPLLRGKPVLVIREIRILSYTASMAYTGMVIFPTRVVKDNVIAEQFGSITKVKIRAFAIIKLLRKLVIRGLELVFPIGKNGIFRFQGGDLLQSFIVAFLER